MLSNGWAWLSAPSELVPHGFCLTWNPTLLIWNILGNGMVALAYVIIPMQLLLVKRRQASSLPGWVQLMFASFILLCGLSHMLDIVTLFRPWYWLETSEKVLTGIVSLLTAWMMRLVLIPPPRPIIELTTHPTVGDE